MKRKVLRISSQWQPWSIKPSVGLFLAQALCGYTGPTAEQSKWEKLWPNNDDKSVSFTFPFLSFFFSFYFFTSISDSPFPSSSPPLRSVSKTRGKQWKSSNRTYWLCTSVGSKMPEVGLQLASAAEAVAAGRVDSCLHLEEDSIHRSAHSFLS